MKIFGFGGDNIESTDSLEYGFSASGLKELDNDLNQLLYDDIVEALDNMLKEVEDQLDKCWQGESKDRYVSDLEDRVEVVKDEIEDEYKDLQSRFEDLSKFYANQDENLYVSN